jgi:Leucine-rich repeat (LRR) protein
MNSVHKSILILFILALFIQCTKEPETVAIPDRNFLDVLIKMGIDKNNDGSINPEEAAEIKSLEIDSSRIYNLKGIEAFTNLETLSIKNNPLTSLDLSHNSLLSFLDCRSNSLTTLNVSENYELEQLHCSNNALTILDLSNNILLGALDCGVNQLKTIDLSNNTALYYINCIANSLTGLDISKNNSIRGLDCDFNPLTSLDLSENTLLQHLRCRYTGITSLDLSDNSGIVSLDLEFNPSLKKVCVWAMPFPPNGVSIYTTGSPNIDFTTECNK